MSETEQKVVIEQEEEELVDYDEDADADASAEVGADKTAGTKAKELQKKGSYVGIHSSGFRDFLLKSELLLAVTDCGFEHPSEGIEPTCDPHATKGIASSHRSRFRPPAARCPQSIWRCRGGPTNSLADHLPYIHTR
jgi:hypothetical protein